MTKLFKHETWIIVTVDTIWMNYDFMVLKRADDWIVQVDLQIFEF